MASNESSSPPPEGVEGILNLISTWAGNFQRNTSQAFVDLRPKDYIRLIVIIGGYCLLRPYLMKLGAKLQARDLEKMEKASAEADKTELNANDLRGVRKEIPGVESEDEGSEEEETSNWGRKAKIRQRKMIRKRLEEHEERLRSLQPTESDEEVEEFLVD